MVVYRWNNPKNVQSYQENLCDGLLSSKVLGWGILFIRFVDWKPRTLEKRTHSGTLLKMIVCVCLRILRSFATQKLLRTPLSGCFSVMVPIVCKLWNHSYSRLESGFIDIAYCGCFLETAFVVAIQIFSRKFR